MRRLAGIAAALAIAISLGACTATDDIDTTGSIAPTRSAAPPPQPLEKFYSQQLRWSGCGGDFDCTTLTVPMDYDAPDAATTNVAVIRLRAAEPDKRVGSLVINPGGPGGSGVDYARAARAVFDPVLRNRYDIVGFDPRGVGQSEPITCMSDRLRDQLISSDPAPTTPAGIAGVDAIARRVAGSCRRNGGDLLAHVGTENVARDVDVLRSALGDRQLYWFGASYGTYIGATYADLFPGNVARMVLDGAIDPTLPNTEVAHGQAQGFELALRRFSADCSRQSDCPLPAGADTGVARIQQFFDEVAAEPLSTRGRPLTDGLATNAVAFYLYAPPYDWATLRLGLTAAFRGDGSVLLAMLDQRLRRGNDGVYKDNSLDALYFVNALDRADRPGLAETTKLAARWAQEAPTFGPFLAWSNLSNHYWPVPATGTARRITAVGAPPILVAGTTNDPATPYVWALGLAKQLASGVLLTRVGDGHTAYGMGSPCIDKAIDRYLITGVAPEPDTVCSTDSG